jgi:hypothetical protein
MNETSLDVVLPGLSSVIPPVEIFHEKVLEANKLKTNWSSEFPLSLNKKGSAKKVTIYQLMIDSKIELKR